MRWNGVRFGYKYRRVWDDLFGGKPVVIGKKLLTRRTLERNFATQHSQEGMKPNIRHTAQLTGDGIGESPLRSRLLEWLRRHLEGIFVNDITRAFSSSRFNVDIMGFENIAQPSFW